MIGDGSGVVPEEESGSVRDDDVSRRGSAHDASQPSDDRDTPMTTPAPPRTDLDLSVRARSVSKVYGDGPTAVHALDELDLDIPTGEFLAVMGPSGSGKSTLLHVLAGLDSPTAGSVAVDGVEIGGLNDKQLTTLRRDRIGFVFQAYNLVPTLTARENITLPVDLAGRDTDQAWFDQLVEVLGIADRLDHRPSELSGGQQQRVAAARALINRPAVVFADEPTGALDSVAAGGLLRFLQQAAAEFDQTIVMVTHDPVAAAHAERVIFLQDGRRSDELDRPDVDRVLERVRALEA